MILQSLDQLTIVEKMIRFPSEKLIHNETQRLIENTSEYVYDLMLQDVFLKTDTEKTRRKRLRNVTSLKLIIYMERFSHSVVSNFVTPLTVAYQAPIFCL